MILRMQERNRRAVIWRYVKRTMRRRVPSSLAVTAIAAVVGAATGGGAILFWITVSAIESLLYGGGPQNLYSIASRLPWWQLLAWPTAGGFVIGQVIHYTLLDRRPHGVADVIEATALRGGYLSMRNGVSAALVSAASIGCGASVGREGPIVHFGATIGAWIARNTRISHAQVRRLIACGVAAAVAASFNAPIAGAVFAIEVVVGKYTLNTFAPIAISTVAGTLVSRLYFGTEPAFSIPAHAVSSLQDIPVYALLGAVSALASIALLSAVSLTRATFDRLHFPDRFRPALGGFAVGLIALSTPQVLGVGYETTNAALQEALPTALLAMLVVTKILATGVSLGSGFGGGMFSPSLFIGAMCGGAYGAIWLSFTSDAVTGYSAFTIVGMGAVVAATLGAPLSTTLIVFEMTGDYALTLAVMFTAITSSILVNDIWGRSFFSWQLESRGVDLRRSQPEKLMRQVRVSDLMSSDYMTVDCDATGEALRTAVRGRKPVFVTDETGSYVGTLFPADVREPANVEMDARAICTRQNSLSISDTLAKGLAINEGNTATVIPVLGGDGGNLRLSGYVSVEAMLHAYRGILERVARENRVLDD